MTDMIKLYGIIFLIFLTKSALYNEDERVVGPTLREQLDQEYRNSLCCTKKMRCCRRARAPNIELRAVLARCMNPPFGSCKTRMMKKVINPENEQNIKNFEGFDEDEPLTQSTVTKCHKKVVLTVKIKNSGRTNTKSQFIVIDHVYDPVSSKTVRLLNPYVLKLKQEHVSQAYPLKFLSFVNSEAKEQVYNKHDGNYTGCRTDPKTATCGIVKYQGKIVPYSQGFCCSCDAKKNAERQPDAGTEPEAMKIENSDPLHLFDSVECAPTHITQKEKNRKSKSSVERGGDQNQHSKVNGEDYGEKAKNCITKIYDDYLDAAEDKTIIPFRSNAHKYFTNKGRAQESTKEFSGVRHNDNTKQTFRKSEDYEELRPNKIRSEDNYVKSVENKLIKPGKSSDGVSSGNLVEPDLQTILQDASRISIMALRDYYGKRKMHDREENEGRVKRKIPPGGVQERSDGRKRQVQSSGVQKRGGQNCADRYTPPHLNPQAYHESTHCLRFSPVWYGVYKIEKPVVQQETIIQVFEKYESENGQTKWKDLTNGKKIRLGTFSPSYQDETPTISFTYQYTSDDTESCLDYGNYRLLIPESSKDCDLQKYAETRGGAKEYLMVEKKKIVLSGDQCDVAGVGFQAFYMQPNRCSMPRGTCLHHQPKQMWLHDKKMERLDKPGCYFLKYHGILSSDPIRVNASNNEKFLNLNYYGQHESVIEMEINADFNAVLRTPASAVITEVYTDSTSGTKSYIIVKVTNSGLLSSCFYVRIADCPFELNKKFRGVKSKLVVIAPQNQHIFRLILNSDTSAEIFYCSVEAINVKNELVAIRRIRIQKFDRCICSWHCLCACTGSRQGLKCIPMEVEHYHAAGFLGGLPVISYVRRFTTTVDGALTLVFYILLFILFTLLMLGLTKALIGLCCLTVGLWGLNILLDLPKPMNRYYERNLRSRPVEYDSEGWPIHPDTKARVRNIPKIVEFCTNVIFFYTYPCVVLLLVFKKLCCPFYTYETETIDSSSRNVSVCGKGCGDKLCIHTCPVRDNKKKWKGEKSKGKEVKKKPTIKICIKKSNVKSSNEDIEISDNPYYISSRSNSSILSRSKKNTKSSK